MAAKKKKKNPALIAPEKMCDRNAEMKGHAYGFTVRFDAGGVYRQAAFSTHQEAAQFVADYFAMPTRGD